MKKGTKIWLIVAAFLVVLGCIVFVGAMTTLKWDFTKLSTVKYETDTYEINEDFDSISVNTDTADIVFVLSDECKVECYERENIKHSVTVENGTLAIETKDERTLRDYIGINFSTPEIRVYLPKAEYDALVICENTGDVKIPDGLTFNGADISLTTGDVDFSADACDLVKIKVSTGDIAMKNINVGALELTVSTGDVYITDAACESVTSKGSTGDIFLKNVIASKNISIERSTGDVKLDSTDGAEITVKTDTGNITGSLLTEKVFFAETNTGYVDVPKTVSGGKCEVMTDTGDIRITVIAS